MYLLGYSLNNLSLMALTVSTGFVVDDAIVVLENIARHIEDGMPRVQAALRGAREVSFTVVSMSLSLIAVFLPILLMGGLVGRLFREFAMTLSLAIMVSLVISLTTTPMMCALLLKPSDRQTPKRQTLFDRVQVVYGRTLAWSLRHPALVMLVLLATVGLNFVLYAVVPKGFFPQQDTGLVLGRVEADQAISFQAMQAKLTAMSRIVQEDPAVQIVVGFTGAGGGGNASQTNTALVYIALKPLSERDSMDEVMTRLRRKLSTEPGAQLYLIPIQDIQIGGRSSNATYQYTLEADSAEELYEWTPKLVSALQRDPLLRDVSSDQQQKGLETEVVIDRASAARLGINVNQIDNTLYNAFGQRQVSTIYQEQNQYHVVLEVAPRYWQSPETLRDIYVSTSGGPASGTEATNAVVGTVVSSTSGSKSSAETIALSSARNAANNSLADTGKGGASSGAPVSTALETMVPLSVMASFGHGNSPLAVNHQGPFVATTISFNLTPGASLSEAETAVDRTMLTIGMPASIHGGFAGAAQTFEESLRAIPFLLLAALGTIYFVLGVLYESYVHPVTILSTLPSAGIGALLALMLCRTEFSLIAAIGIILLIGIVKKNAILMIDFALEAERTMGQEPREAIFEACLMRFRPIMMTTSAAMLGALPLALSFGDGSELRRPLGISILGGLALSQVLTLYTTPVVYLYLDRFRLAAKRQWCRAFPNLDVPGAAK